MERYLNRHFSPLLTWMMPYFLIRIWAFKKIAHWLSADRIKGSYLNQAPNPTPHPWALSCFAGWLCLCREGSGDRGGQLPATRGVRSTHSGNLREDPPGSAIRNIPIPTFPVCLSHWVSFAQVHSGSSRLVFVLFLGLMSARNERCYRMWSPLLVFLDSSALGSYGARFWRTVPR